jgi:hypothetical protein
MGRVRFTLSRANELEPKLVRIGRVPRALLRDSSPELATGYAPVPGYIPSSTGSKPNQQIRFVACDEDGTSASGLSATGDWWTSGVTLPNNPGANRISSLLHKPESVHRRRVFLARGTTRKVSEDSGFHCWTDRRPRGRRLAFARRFRSHTADTALVDHVGRALCMSKCCCRGRSALAELLRALPTAGPSPYIDESKNVVRFCS